MRTPLWGILEDILEYFLSLRGEGEIVYHLAHKCVGKSATGCMGSISASGRWLCFHHQDRGNRGHRQD